MIYRIGFWIGPQPESSEEACADFHQRVFAAEAAWRFYDAQLPPLPRMKRFVEAVLDRIPDDHGDRDCPWKYFPVADDAMADTFMPVLRGGFGGVMGILTELAAEHDIRGIDLAAHRLLSLDSVSYLDGEPWAPVDNGNGGPSSAEMCRGPEIARSRLGLSAPAVDLEDDSCTSMEEGSAQL